MSGTINAIEVKGLCKSLGGQEILKGISFSVEKGTAFGYIGPNGSGKTTTIKHLLGFLFPDKGEISILGMKPGSDELLPKIGFVPERPYFYDYLTGRELLRLFGRLSGMGGKLLESRIDELLSAVGLSEAGDIQLRKYSKGMVQRAGVAQALLTKPDVLILDEPMSGLDPLGRYEMNELFRELVKNGTTLIISSHILPDVERLCKTICIIHEGEIIAKGGLDELILAKPDAYTITLAKIQPEWLSILPEKATLVEERGGAVTMETGEEGKRFILGAVKEGKAALVSIAPTRQSLEEFVVSEIAKRQKETRRQ
ncbi:MAG: ABC transporter ATP-binding protein [Myxococcota bacterium]